MKRLCKWLLRVLPYDKTYVFYRTDSRIDGTSRVSIEFYQDVYRRRRLFRRAVYWNGTILVRVVLQDVRFYTRGKKGVTSPLRGAQEYTLRCDNDYVELLKHLSALEIRGKITVQERVSVIGWEDLLMRMWPPRSGCHINHLEEEEEEVET